MNRKNSSTVSRNLFYSLPFQFLLMCLYSVQICICLFISLFIESTFYCSCSLQIDLYVAATERPHSFLPMLLVSVDHHTLNPLLPVSRMLNFNSAVCFLIYRTNVVMNYSEVESKVREATNDDPWGPSGQLMTEISR